MKKQVTITISDNDKTHCLEQSVKILGRPNLSGYIAVLIQKDKHNEKN